jgi:hypothetical protein
MNASSSVILAIVFSSGFYEMQKTLSAWVKAAWLNSIATSMSMFLLYFILGCITSDNHREVIGSW